MSNEVFRLYLCLRICRWQISKQYLNLRNFVAEKLSLLLVIKFQIAFKFNEISTNRVVELNHTHRYQFIVRCILLFIKHTMLQL